ncbi:MAG: TlpA family protein disulfide reductase [Desulfuromusa sp.]|nr:TlpA family protein disulfide reductase [Desulfuromusa sp.]
MHRSKKNIFGIVVLLTVFLLVGCDNTTSEQPLTKVNSESKLAADFTLTNMQGEQISLSQYRGKVVILNFWATWCPPCREEMPSMERLYRNHKDQGLVMLAINVDENGKKAVSQFLRRTPYSFQILLDSDNVAQNAYGVFRFPESFIIDRNGMMVKKIIGGRDWLSGSTFELIKFLLNG